ncbi:hypothetical protein QR685DRAFT_544629 [Neurospora intermedia]|uniref:Uncharacterized protein n=1 Tax=Neurospora intermedia TaxID=5142 RepID=A0ABR3DEG7_NEUIN
MSSPVRPFSVTRDVPGVPDVPDSQSLGSLRTSVAIAAGPATVGLVWIGLCTKKGKGNEYYTTIPSTTASGIDNRGEDVIDAQPNSRRIREVHACDPFSHSAPGTDTGSLGDWRSGSGARQHPQSVLS